MKAFNKTATSAFVVLIAGALLMVSCKKESGGTSNPTASQLDPGKGAGGDVLTLTGSDLAKVQSIVFDKGNVPASFNPNFNTAGAVIFRVPDTAIGGTQNIVFTNIDGKTLTVPFEVIALPKITSASNYDFVTGTQITLTGNNLENVSAVVLNGTTDAATIVSKSHKTLVIQMPATVATLAKLKITNNYGTTVTSQEFASITNNFIVFAEDFGAGAYAAGVQSWSFDCNAYSSTDFAVLGAKSLRADYTKDGGGLSLFLGCNWATPNLTFSDFFAAKYLTFWARAVGSQMNITIVPDNPWSGNDIWGAATATGSVSQVVPKDTWTYFKIPAGSFSGKYSRIDIKILGGTGTIYYDDILFVQ